MIAVFSLMRRRSGIDIEAFNRHWLDPHGVLVCRFPKLRRYSQNRVTAAFSPAAEALGLDGIAELAYDSNEDQETATNSAEMAACDVDSPQFIGAVVRVVTEATIVTPPPSGSGLPKLVLVFPPGASPPSLEPAGLVGRIENTTRLQRGPKSAMPVVDFPVGHIRELWFESQDALAAASRAVSSDGTAVLGIDEVRLV